jgi:hypothetical protein
MLGQRMSVFAVKVSDENYGDRNQIKSYSEFAPGDVPNGPVASGTTISSGDIPF